jgi:voltage-gated sodium channel
MLPRTKVSPFSPEDVLSPTSAALAAPESPWQPARDDDLAWITEAVNADAEKEEDASTADSDDKIVGPHGEHVIPKRPGTPLSTIVANVFDLVMGIAVVVNAVVISLETDYGDQHPAAFAQVGDVFVVIFVLELTVRFAGEPKTYFTDAFNVFDFFLVAFSIVEGWYLSQGFRFIFMAGTPSLAAWWMETTGIKPGTDDGGGALNMLSLLRVLRLLRLVRLIRMMTRFKELILLINGFISALRTVFWAMLFLSMIVIGFAIVFVKIFYKRGVAYDFGDVSAYDNFGTVPKTVMTLCMCMTEGCVEGTIRPIVEEEPYMFAPWFAFLTLTYLGIMNMIVGILCETISNSAATDELNFNSKEELYKKRVLRAVTEIFEDIDVDGSGLLDREEFSSALMTNPSVQEGLFILDLADEENLFDTLDSDKSGTISFEEWANGVRLIMAGKRKCKGKDVVGTYLMSKALIDASQAAEEDDAYIRSMIADMRPMFLGGAE